MAAGAEPAPRGGRFLEERPLRSRLADPIFQWVLALVAALVLLLIGFFFAFLIDKARPALAHQGVLSFAFSNDWNPSREIYGGWPLVAGTLIT
jgi:phosphate transport system permease protein